MEGLASTASGSTGRRLDTSLRRVGVTFLRAGAGTGSIGRLRFPDARSVRGGEGSGERSGGDVGLRTAAVDFGVGCPDEAAGGRTSCLIEGPDGGISCSTEELDGTASRPPNDVDARRTRYTVGASGRGRGPTFDEASSIDS